MVQDLKNQKISEDIIDKELDQELEAFDKQLEPKSGRIPSKRRYEVPSKDKNNLFEKQDKAKNFNVKLESIDGGLESVSKWKKESAIKTPKKSVVKQGKQGRNLPQL